MKNLTKAEEQIIQILWKFGKATTKEILQELPDPKPAITTVSTIVRILESKGFVGHEPFKRGYIYYPILKKEEYAKQSLGKMLTNYFDGSYKKMLSFFVKDGEMSMQELEEILIEINNKNQTHD